MFRLRFHAHGVPGAYVGNKHEKSVYGHAGETFDESQMAQQEEVRQMIGDGEFENIALRVVVDAEPERDSKVAGFIEQLVGMPSLHFCGENDL